MDPRLTDRIDELFSIFPDVTIEISTNGAALTPTRSDQLLSVVSKPNRRLDMWISHHGTTAATVRETDHFDVVICNHVLEHVVRDLDAMTELYRVLSHGGWASLLVPLSSEPTTIESTGNESAEDRLRLFGQEDHVRISPYPRLSTSVPRPHERYDIFMTTTLSTPGPSSPSAPLPRI